MSWKKKAVLLVILTALLLFIWPQPRQWLQRQTNIAICTLHRIDHYPNIASLMNAPTPASYWAQSLWWCRGDVNGVLALSPQGDIVAARRAVAAYTVLIEYHQRDYIRSQRAEMLALLGETEAVLADYNYLLSLNPESYGILERRGALYRQMGATEQALADYQALLAHVQTTSGYYTAAYLAHLQQIVAELEEELDS